MNCYESYTFDIATIIRGLTLTTCICLFTPALPTYAIFDGFGDADRNNNGTITTYDTDIDLNGNIDFDEVSSALDSSDVGIQWVATRGFTNVIADAKANIKVIDDSNGDVDSPGLKSGYALAYDSKGRGGSAAGMFVNPISVGASVGDKVFAEFDFRVWTQAFIANPVVPPQSSLLHWGLFQDSDNQFGASDLVGRNNSNVVWGHHSSNGENDGEWRGNDPGPVGDKGLWTVMPLGVGSGLFGPDPLDARISYEHNSGNFLEGIVGIGGDRAIVASPASDGPGGALTSSLLNSHTLRLEIVRTSTSLEVASFIDGVETLRNVIDQSNPDVQALGQLPESFDYIALRNTGLDDFDFVIDNVRIESVPIPEPTFAAFVTLLTIGLLPLRLRGSANC